MNRYVIFAFALFSISASAQERWKGKFEQLEQTLPTPNEYRTGSGAPGPNYWQQKADYVINIVLNDQNQTISGSETITYHNNSPDVLTYLWLQLEQNLHSRENALAKTSTETVEDSVAAFEYAKTTTDFQGGYKITAVKDASGKSLSYVINNTMMRVNISQPLQPGQKISFSIDWSYNIADRNIFRDERSGLEYFPEDGNYLYAIAQFFPRMCVYDDYEGWQNKQFLGQGEFALPFGDYKVRITVPADHIVAATGVLKNPQEVLSRMELDRFEKSKTSFEKPMMIVTQAEATQKEKNKSSAQKTWEFHADNVRDFAFASSRKFIWDAQAVKVGGKSTMAMSFYPKEGNPLWEAESTKAIKNTLEVYSRMTIEYPYPVAISVHTARIGMEYPMICFNHGRPGKDGSISKQLRQRMIGVIVHEVGHNFFPMIVNSDERQSTWMDEGLNSFVQLVTELERYPDFSWSRGIPSQITPYMKGDRSVMRPLMTTSDNVVDENFGAEQYAKAATALFILRETVMGRDLFDRSFREYAQRWAFKHPKPADFFRTMEDASAVDLDWFWRGWFYTTDNVDLALEKVRWFRMRSKDEDPEKRGVTVRESNASATGKTGEDFGNGPEPFSLVKTNAMFSGEFRSAVDDQAIIQRLQDRNIYEITVTNKGGLVTPVIVEWTFKDGSRETDRIPAEIWRINETKVTKIFVKDKEVTNVVLDPQQETADVNMADNIFPKTGRGSKFDQFKSK